MKLLTSTLLAALSTLLFIAPTPTARADVDVSLDFFYDELDPYGDWFYVEDYGYCWQPAVNDYSWRPYNDGDWIYTDAGWAWNSDEQWGWATYHYGRWTNLRGRGWAWVPGYEWAPAWVSWRSGGDYIGWAPLPPEAIYRPNVGISIGFSFGIGPSNYNFCRYRDFGYSNVGRYVVPYRDNVNIINQTTNITNITNVTNIDNSTTIYNGGPDYNQLQERSRRSIPRANIERVKLADQSGGGRAKLNNSLKGDRLRVVAPNVKRKDGLKPKKVTGRVSKKDVDDGWSSVKDRNKVAKIRDQVRQQDRAASQRKPKSQDNRSNRTADNQSGKNKSGSSNQTRQGNSSGLKPFLGGSKRDNSNQKSSGQQDRQRAERQQAEARDNRQRQNDRTQQSRKQSQTRDQRQTEQPKKKGGLFSFLNRGNREKDSRKTAPQSANDRTQRPPQTGNRQSSSQSQRAQADRQRAQQRAERQQVEQRAERQKAEDRAQRQRQAERAQQPQRQANDQRAQQQRSQQQRNQRQQPQQLNQRDRGQRQQADQERARREAAQRQQSAQRQQAARAQQQRRAQAQSDERAKQKSQAERQARQRQQATAAATPPTGTAAKSAAPEPTAAVLLPATTARESSAVVNPPALSFHRRRGGEAFPPGISENFVRGYPDSPHLQPPAPRPRINPYAKVVVLARPHRFRCGVDRRAGAGDRPHPSGGRF